MATVAVMRSSVIVVPDGPGGRPIVNDPRRPEPPRRPHHKRHPKMRIVAEGRDAFEVPFAPNNVTLDGVVPTWQTADRGGREPLLLRSGNGLPQISFDLVFGHTDPNTSIENGLTRLRSLAGSGRRMRVKLDATTSQYLWRLTGFTQQVTARQQGTNAATRAVCTLTFQKASDAAVAVGPTSGGHKGKGDDKRPRFYTVKRGDTLQSIARRFYGQASAWHKIADANKLRHPKKLKVGRKLRLP